MDQIVICKARSTGGHAVYGCEIIIGADVVPEKLSLDGCRRLFESEAAVLESTLYRNLPGGTYERLLAHMIMRQASLLTVSLGT